jgi:hypothetical protein
VSGGLLEKFTLKASPQSVRVSKSSTIFLRARPTVPYIASSCKVPAQTCKRLNSIVLSTAPTDLLSTRPSTDLTVGCHIKETLGELGERETPAEDLESPVTDTGEEASSLRVDQVDLVCAPTAPNHCTELSTPTELNAPSQTITRSSANALFALLQTNARRSSVTLFNAPSQINNIAQSALGTLPYAPSEIIARTSACPLD